MNTFDKAINYRVWEGITQGCRDQIREQIRDQGGYKIMNAVGFNVQNQVWFASARIADRMGIYLQSYDFNTR